MILEKFWWYAGLFVKSHLFNEVHDNDKRILDTNKTLEKYF